MNNIYESSNKSSIHPRSGKRLINVPSVDLPERQITVENLDHDLRERIYTIRDEFIEGLEFIREHAHSVTFFGSARFKEDHEYYKKAQSLARKVAKLGIDVITGGGPGIMEAANRGASETNNAHSLGLGINLSDEQVLNPYVGDDVVFHYFFSRKVALTFSAESYIFFPGGFGTLDEFFEILTLVQTNKIKKTPIILFGSDFWNRFDDFVKETLRDEYRTIDHSDVNLYTITDDEDEALKIIKNAPMRKE